MDLSVFEQDETCDVIIVDPTTGENTDIIIVVYGMDSKQYRKSKAILDASDIDPDDKPERLLAMLTKSWKNLDYKGKAVELTLDSAEDIYKKIPIIYDQLEKVIFNRVKFMKALPKA